MQMQPPRFVFFGTPRFAVIVLEELEKDGLRPVLVVTAPDRPAGRGLVLTPSPVKEWAAARNIPALTPERIRGNAGVLAVLRSNPVDCFVVAAYGQILPKEVLGMMPFGTLNVHPSLLPKFRGPSPIESAILSNETRTGVTIILLDEEMDHGPILAEEDDVPLEPRPRGSELEMTLAHKGGSLLASTMRRWIAKAIKPRPQEDWLATFTKKIAKEDGAIAIDGDPVTNWKKVRAFDAWPGAHFFTERHGKRIRVRINDAIMDDNNKLTITRVVPEGKKEMSYQDFLRGQ